jgi:hypothetical protein
MAGAQVGCIVVSDSINVEAFIAKAKEEKYVVEKEQIGNDGRKYIPIHKQG